MWGLLPEGPALGLGVSLGILTLIRGGLSAWDLHRSRRQGDAQLRAYGLPPISGVAAWRSTELTSDRSRRRLARGVQQLRHETQACRHSGDPPVESILLDKSVLLLRRLECRLGMQSEPVSPVGMLDMRTLALDELSPLYFPERADDLPVALLLALVVLEPA